MGCRAGITAGISRHVIDSYYPDFQRWMIGLTNDIPALYRAWNRPAGFMCWRADSIGIARSVEHYFIRSKGMKGGLAAALDDRRPVSVCLFLSAAVSPLPTQTGSIAAA